ncbi:LOW QUALITY PROTEIN: uncharacterized protein KZ484_022857 [Pholidichthys leucotaenia]
MPRPLQRQPTSSLPRNSGKLIVSCRSCLSSCFSHSSYAIVLPKRRILDVGGAFTGGTGEQAACSLSSPPTLEGSPKAPCCSHVSELLITWGGETCCVAITPACSCTDGSLLDDFYRRQCRCCSFPLPNLSTSLPALEVSSPHIEEPRVAVDTEGDKTASDAAGVNLNQENRQVPFQFTPISDKQFCLFPGQETQDLQFPEFSQPAACDDPSPVLSMSPWCASVKTPVPKPSREAEEEPEVLENPDPGLPERIRCYLGCQTTTLSDYNDVSPAALVEVDMVSELLTRVVGEQSISPEAAEDPSSALEAVASPTSLAGECPCPPHSVVKAPSVARHSVWCCTLGLSHCRQTENREACVCMRISSTMDTEFSKRVYQGVRVKHTVKDLLAEKRSRQTTGPRYSGGATTPPSFVQMPGSHMLPGYYGMRRPFISDSDFCPSAKQFSPDVYSTTLGGKPLGCEPSTMATYSSLIDSYYPETFGDYRSAATFSSSGGSFLPSSALSSLLPPFSSESSHLFLRDTWEQSEPVSQVEGLCPDSLTSVAVPPSMPSPEPSGSPSQYRSPSRGSSMVPVSSSQPYTTLHPLEDAHYHPLTTSSTYPTPSSFPCPPYMSSPVSDLVSKMVTEEAAEGHSSLPSVADPHSSWAKEDGVSSWSPYEIRRSY